MSFSAPSKTTILLLRVRPVRRRSVCLAWPFAKNFHFTSDQPFAGALRRRVDHLEQVPIAGLFHLLVNLLSHLRPQAFRSAANSERQTHCRIAPARPERVFFRNRSSVSPGKPDDHVGREGDILARRAQLVDQPKIFLRGVGAMHRLENSVRPGLQRQMDVLAKFRQIAQRRDQIRAKTDRMRRSKTQTLEAINVVHRFEQLDEGAFVRPGSATSATVGNSWRP